mmetsp:Transcript_4093/g.6625  ORF Transcript_4093/g.6625 Transcript_4093/m.6625 type:complete len:588 (-) Transcript_4093:11-1774(-)
MSTARQQRGLALRPTTGGSVHPGVRCREGGSRGAQPLPGRIHGHLFRAAAGAPPRAAGRVGRPRQLAAVALPRALRPVPHAGQPGPDHRLRRRRAQLLPGPGRGPGQHGAAHALGRRHGRPAGGLHLRLRVPGGDARHPARLPDPGVLRGRVQQRPVHAAEEQLAHPEPGPHAGGAAQPRARPDLARPGLRAEAVVPVAPGPRGGPGHLAAGRVPPPGRVLAVVPEGVPAAAGGGGGGGRRGARAAAGVRAAAGRGAVPAAQLEAPDAERGRGAGRGWAGGLLGRPAAGGQPGRVGYAAGRVGGAAGRRPEPRAPVAAARGRCAPGPVPGVPGAGDRAGAHAAGGLAGQGRGAAGRGAAGGRRRAHRRGAGGLLPGRGAGGRAHRGGGRHAAEAGPAVPGVRGRARGRAGAARGAGAAAGQRAGLARPGAGALPPARRRPAGRGEGGRRAGAGALAARQGDTADGEARRVAAGAAGQGQQRSRRRPDGTGRTAAGVVGGQDIRDGGVLLNIGQSPSPSIYKYIYMFFLGVVLHLYATECSVYRQHGTDFLFWLLQLVLCLMMIIFDIAYSKSGYHVVLHATMAVVAV